VVSFTFRSLVLDMHFGKGYVFYGLIRHSNNWAEQFLKQIERLRR